MGIADHVLAQLGITRKSEEPPQALGRLLEVLVAQDLEAQIPKLEPGTPWTFTRGGKIAAYSQYTHLARLQAVVRENPTLKAEVAMDYLISPDFTIGVDGKPAPALHAVVSSKFTIRSDRVQNIRQEAHILIRHRRGRLPHIAVVTVEPMASRILAIARGTGEVDCVYHLALDELKSATDERGTKPQKQALDEAVSQDRLRSYDDLLDRLTAR